MNKVDKSLINTIGPQCFVKCIIAHLMMPEIFLEVTIETRV